MNVRRVTMRMRLLAALALVPFAANALPLPETPTETNLESYFGVTVDDRYRWLENLETGDVREWFTRQNDYTREVLDALPGRAALRARIAALNNADTRIRALQSAGDALFYLKRPAGEQNFKLYMRGGQSDGERVLLDPERYDAAGQTAGIDYYRASPNGKRVAVGISTGGSENATLYVFDVASGRVLGPPVRPARFAQPSWRFDSDALFYVRQKEPQPGALPADWLRDGRVEMRSYGSDERVQDVPVFGRGLNAGVDLAADDMPAVVVSPISPFAIGVVRHGVRRERTLYVVPLPQVRDAATPWRKLVGVEGGVTSFTLRGEWIYFVTNVGAPHGKVLRWSLRDPRPFALADAEVVVATSDRIIAQVAAAKDALYVQEREAGYGRLQRLEYNVKLPKPKPAARRGARAPASKAPAALPKLSGIARGSDVQLPFAGALDELATDPLRSGAYLRMTGWTQPPDFFSVDGKTGQAARVRWAQPGKVDNGNIATLQTLVRSHDGTSVPLSIVYAKDVARNGTAPLLLEAYGAYGVSREPYFWPSLLAWLERGGVFAVAHVRGGGELGNDWHLAGFQATKPNTWRDLIACAEWLVAEHWTAPARLSVMGASAGGVAAGNAIIDRPDLFAAMISRVGFHDTLRGETGMVGPANIPEFGSVATEAGFRALLAMSSYQRLADGVRYPAALFATGFNDSRVDAWDPGKTAARLQAINSAYGGSRKPVLLRVDFAAGHRLATTTQAIELDTDIFSFLLWQTGAAEFSPP